MTLKGHHRRGYRTDRDFMCYPLISSKISEGSARSQTVAFSHWRPGSSRSFCHQNGKDQETLSFEPHLSMNDYTGLSAALLAGAGIGDRPPGVQPELMRDRRLVEVMPEWRFRTFDLSVVHFEQPAYTVSGAIV